MSYWPASEAARGAMSDGSDVTRRGKSGGRSSPQMLLRLGRRGKARRARSAPRPGEGVGWRYLTVTVPDSTVRPCTVQKNEKVPALGKRTKKVPVD